MSFNEIPLKLLCKRDRHASVVLKRPFYVIGGYHAKHQFEIIGLENLQSELWDLTEHTYDRSATTDGSFIYVLVKRTVFK